MIIYNNYTWSKYNITHPYHIIAQKVQSDEVDYGHSSELQVTPVDHQEPTSDVEKDTNSQNARLNVISTKPPALADSLKTNPDDHAVNSNVPSSESYNIIRQYSLVCT